MQGQGQQVAHKDCDLGRIEEYIERVFDLAQRIQKKSEELHNVDHPPEAAKQPEGYSDAANRITARLSNIVVTLEEALEALVAFAG